MREGGNGVIVLPHGPTPVGAPGVVDRNDIAGYGGAGIGEIGRGVSDGVANKVKCSHKSPFNTVVFAW